MRVGPFRISAASALFVGNELNGDPPVRFRFDGRSFAGKAGDSLASALLANGVRTVARSFKFHRPRGGYTCGVEEPNALVQLDSGSRTVPSARATLVELYDGLNAFSQS